MLGILRVYKEQVFHFCDDLKRAWRELRMTFHVDMRMIDLQKNSLSEDACTLPDPVLEHLRSPLADDFPKDIFSISPADIFPKVKQTGVNNFIKSSRMQNPALYHANLKLKNNSVPRFTLKTLKRYAKVVSVYDGDTCDLVFYQDEQQLNLNEPVRYKCRMLDYNAPELEEKPSGELARGYLTHLCTGGNAQTYNAGNLRTEKRVQQKLDNNEDSLVYAEFGGPGKYGRQLVTLYQTLKEEDNSSDKSSCDFVASPDDDPPGYENTSINSMMAQYIDMLP
ncbi:Hypothetical predicted protein [Paramuricea clavata]|uniref:Uncharacterized protein n=2 Tax=Paramuricea clavata TaxID=317549 RepID=A0A7D9E9N3_PARCT|nr:Hypothetical predicted protein [Paramuricea clavata]